MKKTVFSVILLALLGAVIAVFMLPGRQQVALMQFHDARYDEAQAAYERELKEGRLTVDVVRNLTELYLQNGKVDEAVLVMEMFVEKNPDNIDGRFRLGTMYKYAQRPEDYRRNLETIAKLRPSAKVLQELGEIYNFNADYLEQIKVMRELVDQNQAGGAQHYADLAYLQASQKQYPEAIASLQSLRKEFPESMQFSYIELLVSLLMDSKQSDQALAEARSWCARAPEPKEIARLANIIHYRGDPKAALALVTDYEQLASESVELQGEQIALYLVNGREKDAYVIMQRLFAEKRLPASLMQAYLNQAMLNNNEKEIAAIVEKIDVTLLGEPELVFLTEMAQVRQRPEFLALVEKRATPQTLDQMPILATVLALGKNDSKAAGQAVVLAAKDSTAPSAKMQLARACIRAQAPDCAITIMTSLPKDQYFTDAEIAVLGEMYLQTNQTAKGYAFIEQAKKDRPQGNFERVWLRLATAENKAAEITQWLGSEQGKALGGKDVRELYYIASNQGHAAFAADLAKVAYTREPNDESRRILASAYLKSRNYAQAIPLLRENRNKSKQDQDAYIAALYKAASSSPQFKNELAGYYGQLIASKGLTEQRRQQLVYALIAIGRSDMAMPYVKRFAYAEGGSWGSLYEETMKKSNQSAELLNYRLARAKNPTASTKEVRNIGFALLNDGYGDNAMTVFKQLALTAPRESDDAKQLLFLMGPRPSKDNLNWLAERAKRAKGEDQAAWYKTLVDYHGGEYLVALVDQKPELLKDRAMAKLYAQALASSRNYTRLNEVIKEQAATTEDPEMLRDYARMAKQNDQIGAAQVAYQRLSSLQPGDIEATRSLGLIDFSRANYAGARKYFGEFVDARNASGGAGLQTQDPESYQGEYEAFFYTGELLRREKRPLEANKFYQHTINLISHDPAPGIGALSIAAQSYHRMGDEKNAFQIMERLVQENPSDTILRADYVFMLIESKRYKEAQKIIAARQTDKAITDRTLVTKINAQFVRLYQLSEDGHELLIHFVAPVEQIASLKPVIATQHPGISYTTVGYDNMLLVSKGEYAFDLGTTDEKIELYAQRSGRVMQPEMARQAELRMELLTARIELETGSQDAAVKRLEKLQETYPNDGQLLGFAANANYFTGRWRRAMELTRQAQQVSPENEDIATLQRDIANANRANVKADVEWKHMKGKNEYIAGLSGFNYVRPFTRVGGSIENNNVHAKEIRRADGSIEKVSGANRQRLEAYVRHDTSGGTKIVGSLYANNSTPGAGLRLGQANRLGETDVFVEARRPYWEYTEGVLDNATRDRAGFEHKFRLRPDLFGSVGAAYNNYNVKNYDGVMTSLTINGSLRKAIVQRHNFTTTLGYTLDAEYRRSHKTATDGNGTLFSRFPGRTREVHFVDVTASYDIRKTTNLTGYLGYGYDRFGGHGPVVGASLTEQLDDNWEAQARASYGLSARESDENIARVGGYMNYKF